MHVGLNLHQFARCFWDVLSIWYAFPISVWLVVGIGLAVATHYWGAKKLQPGFPNHMIAAQPAIISFWFYIISLHPVFNPQFSPVSPSFLMVKSSRCWSHQVLGWSPLGAMFFRTQSRGVAESSRWISGGGTSLEISVRVYGNFAGENDDKPPVFWGFSVLRQPHWTSGHWRWPLKFAPLDSQRVGTP